MYRFQHIAITGLLSLCFYQSVVAQKYDIDFVPDTIAKPNGLDHHQLYFANGSDEPIWVAVYYLDHDNKWIPNGGWTIEPGRVAHVANTPNGTFGYYIQTNTSRHSTRYATIEQVGKTALLRTTWSEVRPTSNYTVTIDKLNQTYPFQLFTITLREYCAYEFRIGR